MEFVRIGQRVLHVAFRPGRAGARPVVFANSLGTDLRIWDGVIARLPAELPVLCMDKSGHGLSDTGASSIADHAADMAGVMDHCGLSGALFCGVSMGGQIGQHMAAHRPDLIAGLILSNTAARIGTPEMWDTRIAALEQGGIAPMADAVLERWFSPGFLSGQPAAVAGYRNMLVRTPLGGYVAACRAVRDADLTESTRALQLPVACIAGSADQATPTDVVGGLADLIDGAQFSEIAGVGHLPSIEAPEKVAEILMALYEGMM
ncbi:3-oxoadipate enol-lactonase [Actibacterium ureilyticum]|uniref:3-oxoadipate enol-lactonase n=1 Tax=Actibacterium ureilyticum TaxID=1590614 RepID=UPI000BAAB7F4|nr:3-oxoadipate enol-lactonase [Actibacterium ureilyticum]